MTLHIQKNQVVVDAFRKKDERQMEHFYKTQWPLVHAQIKQMGGSTDEAKDIMQNGFMILYEKVRSGQYENRAEASIGTYFQRMCRYMMLNVRKSAHRTRVSSIDKMEMDVADFSEELNLDILERQQQFERYLNAVGDRCRRMLLAFYWEDATLEDIAGNFNLTYSSAKNAKYRCLAKLKDLMATHDR